MVYWLMLKTFYACCTLSASVRVRYTSILLWWNKILSEAVLI